MKAKKFLAMLMVGAALLGLTACGGSKQEAPKKEQTQDNIHIISHPEIGDQYGKMVQILSPFFRGICFSCGYDSDWLRKQPRRTSGYCLQRVEAPD